MKSIIRTTSITVTLILLVGICAARGPAHAQAPHDVAGEVLLFDFEGDAALDRWETQPGAELALTDAWASRGRQALAVTFLRWEPSPEADVADAPEPEDDIEGLADAARSASQNPAAVATRDAGLLEALDRFNSLLDQPETGLLNRLEFDLHNAQDFPVTVRVGLREAERRLAPGGHFTVPPHSTRACSLVLGMPAMRARLQDVQTPSNVVALSISMMLPDRDCIVYADNFRLTVDLLSAATEVASMATEIRDGTGAMPEAVAGRLSAETARLAALADRLLLDIGGGFESWEQVRELRERLVELEGRVERLLPDFNQARIQARSAALGDVPMVLAAESSMRQVFLEQERFRAEFTAEYRMQAARNEYESFQAIIVPVGRDLEAVSWEVEPPRDAAGAELPVTVRVVGYVDTDQPRYTVPDTGWWPDPLLDFMTEIAQIPSDEVVPLWVTVEVPTDATAGLYEGALTVHATDVEPQRLPFSVEVWNFEIPRRSSLRTLFSMSHLAGITPGTLYGDDSGRMQEIYENWLLDRYRIDPTFIYGANPPHWSAERLRELLDRGLQVIRVISINPRRGQPLPEDYWEGMFEERISRAEDYFAVLDEAGASERDDVLQLTYLFDEWSDAQDGGLEIVHETARRISERWGERPEVVNSSCAYDHTYGLGRSGGDAIDIWFPGMATYENNLAHIERARRDGKQIWWYFAIGSFSPRPNWWIESPSIEARLIMGAMTAKYRPDGFMYYNIARWWERPTDRWEADHGRRGIISEGPRTRWHPNSIGRNPGSLANGDGSLICPGPDGPLATIRLENVRDGMEDYEYYVLLRRLLEERGLPAHEAEVAPEVVESIGSFTYDPAAVEAERRRLAERIVELLGNEPRD